MKAETYTTAGAATTITTINTTNYTRKHTHTHAHTRTHQICNENSYEKKHTQQKTKIIIIIIIIIIMIIIIIITIIIKITNIQQQQKAKQTSKSVTGIDSKPTARERRTDTTVCSTTAILHGRHCLVHFALFMAFVVPVLSRLVLLNDNNTILSKS